MWKYLGRRHATVDSLHLRDDITDLAKDSCQEPDRCVGKVSSLSAVLRLHLALKNITFFAQSGVLLLIKRIEAWRRFVRAVVETHQQNYQIPFVRIEVASVGKFELIPDTRYTAIQASL